VGFAGNIVLVAMRDISPGEELTTDYALFDDYDGMMHCRCGTPSCRGMIGGRDWQRPDLQRKYGSYFSSYLLHRLARQPDRPGCVRLHPLMADMPVIASGPIGDQALRGVRPGSGRSCRGFRHGLLAGTECACASITYGVRRPVRHRHTRTTSASS
jgi:hypothetical protein